MKAARKEETHLERFAFGAGESLTKVSEANRLGYLASIPSRFGCASSDGQPPHVHPCRKRSREAPCFIGVSAYHPPQKRESTNCLIYRKTRFILDSSYFSHIFTILVNSFVGYEMSSLTGPVAPAWEYVN